MAEVTGYTAERMKLIEDASIVDGAIVNGELILTRHDGTTINAGPFVVDPLPWNGPWGLAAECPDITVNQMAVPAVQTDLVGFSIPWTPVANRVYEVRCNVDVAGGSGSFHLTDEDNVVIANWYSVPVGSRTLSKIIRGAAAAAVTWKLRGLGAGGAMNILNATDPGQFVILDVGSNGPPA